MDDTFVLLGAWRRTDPSRSVEERLARAFGEAGVSITITSLTNFISFWIGIITPFPSVRIFCIYTAMAVLFTYIYQITMFGGCLAVSGYAEHRNLHSLVCVPTMPRSLAGIGFRLADDEIGIANGMDSSDRWWISSDSVNFSSFIFITMDRKKVYKKSSAKKKMMSIELKREIIEKHEQGVRVVDLSRQYGRSTSMICSVLKRKEPIKSVTPAKGLTIISKLRTSLHENMEKLLMVWVTEKQLQGDTLTQKKSGESEKNVAKKAKTSEDI
ncbi:daf-6 [Cordylochernes scorpioides]|uniref:Daf-6 n=1 Tax=Cordylochernes scorpioides TaxID=51811 RepID=A0ABY6KJS5_9ARAC|nr:daf-6 [Cordylochernes scorpioides]